MNKNTLKTISKAVLLWFTVLYIICYISLVDCLSPVASVIGLLGCIFLGYSCSIVIENVKELSRLLGNDFFDKFS